eukprot:IDg14198t1
MLTAETADRAHCDMATKATTALSAPCGYRFALHRACLISIPHGPRRRSTLGTCPTSNPQLSAFALCPKGLLTLSVLLSLNSPLSRKGPAP